ncbi:CZB domain-containing protein [Halovibrio sp. HP20-50]|uniref:methyl-accepting chemotaxis protein n=1 Tax=Halovibrio sp. HP20-59 TaxID=3080275 RepID=UPI00294ADF7D|nr:CZB domain-containing protein [Halovibrio sp. HP20-59]MEA2117982.1 CZB domain-containing protein [Halovibrio sp. HP20-59]
MFTFIHPYQKIRRLEQQVADLRAQLEAPSPSGRLLSLISPQQSIGMLQAQGADMLASLNTGVEAYADQLAGERATLTGTLTFIAAAEQAVNTLHQRCQCSDDTNSASSPLALANTLQDLDQLKAALVRNADHTQTLAVSTALEAAHSQDQQSPGLAAIADDVHRLALNMQQLRHQFSVLIEQANRQVNEHTQAAAKKHQADDEIAHAAQTAKHDLCQLADQAKHMHKVIHQNATAAFLHSAKLDHAVWKCRLYKQLLSADTDTPLEDDHQCRLGQWQQYGEGHQRFAFSAAFRALTAPHRQVHASGAEALKLANEGNRKGQLAALGRMEEASQQLAQKLDSLMEYAMYEAPYPASRHSPLADSP